MSMASQGWGPGAASRHAGLHDQADRVNDDNAVSRPPSSAGPTHRRQSRPSPWAAVLVVVAVMAITAAATWASAPGDVRSDLVSRWVVELREALRAGSLTALEIHGLTVKTDPDRHVEVRQWHHDPAEVRAILEAAFSVLEEGQFELTEARSLATRTVAFMMDVPGICPSESTRFVIASTNRDLFQIGCAAREDDTVGDEVVVRLVSPALFLVMERYIPRELADEDGPW